ncbi:MAG: HD domain-containing protein [Nannocystaceae bacterium]|nr:HD domain-containing protein [Nannocystaceae bacterium]
MTPISLDTVRLPDSALCREATEHARDLSEDFLFNHVMRSYVFAAGAAPARGLRFDPELLFLSSVLHDLGLTESAPVKTRFEVEGADMATDWARERGVDEAELDVLWDAIALHTVLIIPERKCAEIALCQLGAAIDVGFAPLTLVPPEVCKEALHAFPRLQFKSRLPISMCSLIERNPDVATTSDPVAAIAERHETKARPRPHFCDVLHQADFSE